MSEPLGFTHPHVQRLRRLLGRRSARTEEHAFVVEGATLIGEALAGGWAVEAEFVAPGGEPVSDAPCHALAPGVIERVATTERPQPNLAIVTMPPPRGLTGEFLAVADQLGDPGNLGTLLRSSEAAGADAVVLTAGSVDPFNPKVVRAAAGALFHVPVVWSTLAEVGAAGYRLIGTSSHQGRAHTEADWDGRVAVVFGNEAHGLPDDTAVDEWVRIEHRGRAESLNVAMAATVVLFEAARSRAE